MAQGVCIREVCEGWFRYLCTVLHARTECRTEKARTAASLHLGSRAVRRLLRL